MTTIKNIGKDIANPYAADFTEGQCLTGECWPTERISVIKMKDGTFTLGYDVYYFDEQGKQSTETCRIRVNKKTNTPYIMVGGEHDFTEENCDEEIRAFEYTNGGHHHSVENQKPLFTLTDGGSVSEQSVVSFVAKYSHLQSYFSSYAHHANLNPKGLALMVKFIEDPKNSKLIAERVSSPTKEELSMIETELKAKVDQFLSGEVDAHSLNSLITYIEELKKGKAMSKNPILIDMIKIDEHYSTQEDQQ